MLASLASESATNTHSGAMNNATNSAASGRTRGESSLVTRVPLLRHSGARRRREPGIHNLRSWLWIPGPALRAVPEWPTERSHLDLSVEPVDQRAALRID